MEPDKLLSEARARIIWGEAPRSVRDFLIANGISDTISDAKIREFTVERTKEVRSIGMRNLLVGLVLTVAVGVVVWIMFRVSKGYRSGLVRLLGVPVLVGMYGLWKFVTGVNYLVRPQSEHKSIPDIMDSDSIE